MGIYNLKLSASVVVDTNEIVVFCKKQKKDVFKMKLLITTV